MGGTRDISAHIPWPNVTTIAEAKAVMRRWPIRDLITFTLSGILIRLLLGPNAAQQYTRQRFPNLTSR